MGGERAVSGDQAVKVTRARMIIELADGRAMYWEARDPLRAEVEHLRPDDSYRGLELGPMDVSLAADWLGGGWFPRQPRAALRITGGIPWGVQILHDSGEIPPELAERALPAIDRFAAYRAHPLRQLAPYLARIAGKQP
jgi:hypothetical protein